MGQDEMIAGIAALMGGGAAEATETAAAAEPASAPEPAPEPEAAAPTFVAEPAPVPQPAADPAASAPAPESLVDGVAAYLASAPSDAQAPQAEAPALDPNAAKAAPGYAIPPATAAPGPEGPGSETPSEPAAEKPKKKIKPWMIILGVVVLAAIIVAVVFGVMSANRAQDYENANDLYDSHKYAEAAEIYERLGDYEDSPAKLEAANKWIAAEALEKAAGEDPAAWQKAAEAYKAIGSEASSKTNNCEDAVAFYTATQLMAEKKWQEAYDALSDLHSNDFRGAASMRRECEARAGYEKAEALYADGKYYEAYKAFNDVGGNGFDGVSDALDRAQACIQSAPAAGEVARGDAYSGSDVELTIANSSSDNVYYKLYIDGNFVISCFVPGNGEATISLPSGTYTMNKAYGDAWFGPDDMFGDEGEYYQCNFEGSSTVELEPGGMYEISSGGSGTGIGSSATDRGSF